LDIENDHKKIILTIFLLFAGWQAQAQSDVTERLLRIEQEVAGGNLSDDEMYKNYQTLLWQYHTRNKEKTHYYFQKLLAFAREKKNLVEESTCLRYMGAINCEWGARDTALLLLNQALKLIEGKELFEEEYRNYGARGRIYTDMSYYENAIEDYHKALETTQKDKPPELLPNKMLPKIYIWKRIFFIRLQLFMAICTMMINIWKTSFRRKK
jgi:tetratricopeptide (TPR) repeat protein